MKYLITLSAMLCIFHANAQFFNTDTLLYNGDINRRINLVILGDGYQTQEMGKFRADAQKFIDALFREVPFDRYQNYFNIFIINVPSNASGASHPGTAGDVPEPAHPVASVDNYFGSTFDYGGIHRLLVATRTSAVTNVLAQHFPLYDQVFILTNSPYYGGSGGLYPVASTEASSAEIAIHELGHSFANLRDEYWAGDIYAQEAANMTQFIAPNLLKWKNWLNTEGIGTYQYCCGGNASQWYHPHESCKMKLLGPPFCAVCKEAIVEKIHSLVNPIENFTPATSNPILSGAPIQFKLDLIAPTPNTLKVIWDLNGDTIPNNNAPSMTLSPDDFLIGTNTLTVTVEDTTRLLRVNGHGNFHRFAVSWIIRSNVTGIEDIQTARERIFIRTFPNPATDIVHVQIESENAAAIRIELYDAYGKRLESLQQPTVPAGRHHTSLSLQAYPAGMYFLKILVNGVLTTAQILKVE